MLLYVAILCILLADVTTETADICKEVEVKEDETGFLVIAVAGGSDQGFFTLTNKHNELTKFKRGGQSALKRIAYDADSRTLYWLERATIERMNGSCYSSSFLYQSPYDSISDIAVANGLLYYTSHASGIYYRDPADNTDRAVIEKSKGLYLVDEWSRIEVHSASKTMYWTKGHLIFKSSTHGRDWQQWDAAARDISAITLTFDGLSLYDCEVIGNATKIAHKNATTFSILTELDGVRCSDIAVGDTEIYVVDVVDDWHKRLIVKDRFYPFRTRETYSFKGSHIAIQNIKVSPSEPGPDMRLILAVVCSAIVFAILLIVLCFCICVCRRKKLAKTRQASTSTQQTTITTISQESTSTASGMNSATYVMEGPTNPSGSRSFGNQTYGDGPELPKRPKTLGLNNRSRSTGSMESSGLKVSTDPLPDLQNTKKSTKFDHDSSSLQLPTRKTGTNEKAKPSKTGTNEKVKPSKTGTNEKAKPSKTKKDKKSAEEYEPMTPSTSAGAEYMTLTSEKKAKKTSKGKQKGKKTTAQNYNGTPTVYDEIFDVAQETHQYAYPDDGYLKPVPK